jgi:hypothetical protein
MIPYLARLSTAASLSDGATTAYQRGGFHRHRRRGADHRGRAERIDQALSLLEDRLPL